MKYFLVISIVITSLFLAILGYSFSLNEEINIKHSLVLEAPDIVVWNALTNFEDHHKWQKSIKALYNYNYSARQVRYLIGDKTIMANQQVRVLESANTIDFIQIGKEEYTALKNIGGQISVKSLADGNTEISWKLSYRVNSITQKLINKFEIQSHLDILLSNNLNSLKSYIEH
ncbi:MAG: hypothetical protein D8M58_08215 [Calditrichaeota bacterium]|nr:MAG: hypothetical protein DWQ03_18275 [Calditrichota bacterium]MBL1205367.1 hypothetical protein [Calditrichota bacterium]NOG45196.1 hypothetical protein [Calditrichota bacterium]